MNTFKHKVTRKDINEKGFQLIIGKRKLRYEPCGFGFNVFEKGKFIHYVNNLYGDV